MDDDPAGTSVERAEDGVRGKAAWTLSVAARLWRWLLAASLVRLGVLLIERMDDLRTVEASMSARVVAFVMGSSSNPRGTALVYIPVESGQRFTALEITWQSSAVWAALPLLALGAGLVLIPRVSWWRLLCLCAVAIGVVVIMNQVRILVIVLSTAWWGSDGFEIAHRIVGSGLVLLSVVIGIGVVWRFSRANRKLAVERREL